MSDISFELPSALAIDTCCDLHRWLGELMPDLVGNDTLTLDANAVSRLTTPGLQLLCALEKSLALRQVKLSVVNAMPIFTEACTYLGFSSFCKRWSESSEDTHD